MIWLLPVVSVLFFLFVWIGIGSLERIEKSNRRLEKSLHRIADAAETSADDLAAIRQHLESASATDRSAARRN